MGGPKGQVVVCFFLSHAFMFSKINLAEKEMATHSNALAWRIPGAGEPGGLLSMGLHRVRHY